MSDWTDEMRRRVGRGLDALGLGPDEAPYRVAGEFDGARLRAYQPADDAAGPVVLIVPAPFKRVYIWDLLPEVSVVRRLREGGVRVYLLEWLDPTGREDGYGLSEYADRLPAAALGTIAAETGEAVPILAGHSLGGTLAAIYAALYPDRVRGLILADAPLAFGENGGPLARAAKAIPHAGFIRAMVGSPIPGSVINALSVAAAPEAFQMQRVADLAASLLDPAALAIHRRVERWTFDEFPLPGQLFVDVLEQLYREDRFMSGTLTVGATTTAVTQLRAPVVAVTNLVGRIVPPRSMLDALESVPGLRVEVLEYAGDRGPMLQHVGPLVAPVAHAELWPAILEWVARLGRTA